MSHHSNGCSIVRNSFNRIRIQQSEFTRIFYQSRILCLVGFHETLQRKCSIIIQLLVIGRNCVHSYPIVRNQPMISNVQYGITVSDICSMVNWTKSDTLHKGFSDIKEYSYKEPQYTVNQRFSFCPWLMLIPSFHSRLEICKSKGDTSTSANG